ncbi:hypothetical protein CEQ02_00105 (plasmid) [Enterococcus faecalis]|nr:hypothetical protein CEQ02_00105 [Enterococcus faecalis]RTK84208.1 hypothetical protein DRJ79_14610 [Enterococcus faecalis]
MSKAKLIIRLFGFGHVPSIKNYSYLNRNLFIISACRSPFNLVKANVKTPSLHNYRSIFVKMA